MFVRRKKGGESISRWFYSIHSEIQTKKINAEEAVLVKSEDETIQSIINSLKHKSVAELAPWEPPTSPAAIIDAGRRSPHFKDKRELPRKSTDSGARRHEWFESELQEKE